VRPAEEGELPAELGLRLHAVAAGLMRAFPGGDPDARLPPARLSALTRLAEAGWLGVGGLAEAAGVTPATASRLAAALVEGGWVVRRPDPEDGRAVRLEATKAGRRLVERARARKAERIRSLLEPMEPGEVRRLRRAVAILERKLEGPAQAAR